MAEITNTFSSKEAYDAMRDRIFELMEVHHISQKELARQLNISPQTITDWKKGKSHSYMSKLVPLAQALSTSNSWLAFGKGKQFVSIEERNDLIKQDAKRAQEINDVLWSLSESEYIAIINALNKRLQETPPIAGGPDLSPQAAALVAALDRLNEEGQEKLVDYADDLVASGKYKKSGASHLGKEA